MMKVFITLTEYENEPDGTIVTVNTNLPDGSTHHDVTAVFNRALSAMYGYQIGGIYFDDPSSNP
jgi:hypothetical protein